MQPPLLGVFAFASHGGLQLGDFAFGVVHCRRVEAAADWRAFPTAQCRRLRYSTWPPKVNGVSTLPNFESLRLSSNFLLPLAIFPHVLSPLYTIRKPYTSLHVYSTLVIRIEVVHEYALDLGLLFSCCQVFDRDDDSFLFPPRICLQPSRAGLP
jgi:hypothetical protein